MTTQELAHAFVALCAAGDYSGAQKFWSDDVVAVEAFPGPHAVTRGREAILAKQRAWSESVTVHGTTCEGPYVNGEQFSAVFSLDVTSHEGKRETHREVALYTVADGKVVEERFFPLIG